MVEKRSRLSMPSPPLRPLIFVLVALDIALLITFVSAQAYDQMFPASCPSPAYGSKIALTCITPAQALAGGALLLLVLHLPLTLVFLVLSQALLRRRARQSRDVEET